MSLYCWLQRSDRAEANDEAALQSGQQYVKAAEREGMSLAARRRKRKSNKQHHYKEAVKTEIYRQACKHAIKYGNKSAVEKFSGIPST